MPELIETLPNHLACRIHGRILYQAVQASSGVDAELAEAAALLDEAVDSHFDGGNGREGDADGDAGGSADDFIYGDDVFAEAGASVWMGGWGQQRSCSAGGQWIESMFVTCGVPLFRLAQRVRRWPTIPTPTRKVKKTGQRAINPRLCAPVVVRSKTTGL